MKKSVKSWLLRIVCIIAAFLVICGTLTYAVDPFFQWRVKDGQYIIDESSCAPGLIKNYDYDTLLLGSSMVQNFDMELFGKTLNCKPLKIGTGGMTVEAMLDYTLLANETGKADAYYLCIDIANFRDTAARDGEVADYLIKEDILSRLRYALSYDSLLRCMPVDIAFSAITATGRTLPSSYENRVSIDKLGYWADGCTFGEEKVINGWKTGTNSVSEVDTENLYEKMVGGIDHFFSELDFGSAEYVFFFPPYSSLFWAGARQNGYYDTYLDAKEYFIARAEEAGAEVFDFQSGEFTTELDNYKDTTHYSPEINDLMTACFKSGESLVSSGSYPDLRAKMDENTESFCKEYAYLFD